MRKRFIKLSIIACLLISSISLPASARVVEESIESNGLKIEYANDGYFSISSTYNDGKILYFTRYGVSEDDLKSDIYSGTVKFYNEDGSFIKEVDYPEDTEKYSMSDYSNWNRWGYILDTSKVSDSSDFMQAEGQKEIKPSKKDESFSGWLPSYRGDTENGVGYFEVTAVYEHNDGTYSTPLRKVFLVSPASIDATTSPILTAKEDSRTGSYVEYILNYEKGMSDYDLKNIYVTTPDGHKESLELDPNLSFIKYRAVKNGAYLFTLYDTNSKYCTISVFTSGIGYNVDSALEEVSRDDLQVTVTGLPESAKQGETVKAHMHTNLLCDISYNGKVLGKQDADLEVTSNGNYNIQMLDELGISHDYNLQINCFEDNSEDNNKISDSKSYWSSSSTTSDSSSSGKSTDKKLPQTGGIFYKMSMVIGVSLVTLGGIFLGSYYISNRRKKTNE